jgi:copper chaperone
MACSACVDTISKAVATLDPTAKVEADTKTKLVSVETQQPADKVREAIANAGYPVA